MSSEGHGTVSPELQQQLQFGYLHGNFRFWQLQVLQLHELEFVQWQERQSNCQVLTVAVYSEWPRSPAAGFRPRRPGFPRFVRVTGKDRKERTMKRTMTIILLCGSLAVALPASAATSVDCKTNHIVDKWTCEKKYNLAKLKTKEFRGRCFIQGEYDNSPGKQSCSSNSKSVTCTITTSSSRLPVDRAYKTCSCTNWDSFSGKKAKVTVQCTY